MEPPGQPDPDHVLTWRQRKVLQVIRESIRKRGYPPSMQEIGDAVGLTNVSSVSYQVATLEAKGYLRRDGRSPRTFEVRLPGHPPVRPDDGDGGDDDGDELTGFDILSQAATRVPFGSAMIPLPRKLVGEGALFILTMAGDSMVNAAILDGDWVVVRRQADAADGDIVAALIEDAATVKTFKKRGGQIWLMPNNPAYTPVAGDKATILGKVVAVLRSLDQPIGGRESQPEPRQI